MDLIPLVQDGVASEDSIVLVKEHLKECGQCKEILSANSQKDIQIADKKQIKAIKKSLSIMWVSILVIGALIGIGMTFSQGMFYNSFLMPLLGVIAYFILRRRCWVGFVSLFFISYIWQTIQGLLEGAFRDVSIGSILVYGFPFSMIYCILFLFGSIIGFLLHFAFRKEKGGDDI